MSGVELWWIGQAGFRLRDPADGPVVFVDPFLSPIEGRTWGPPLSAAELAAQADVILCTHEHLDHFDRETLRGAGEVAGSRFTLIVPEVLIPEARALGYPADRVVAARPGEALHLSGLTIQPVRARHGVDASDAYTFGENLPPGLVRFLGFVFEIGGVRLYHAGDTIPYPGQADEVRAHAPEVALLAINGRDAYREAQNLVGNLNEVEAARLAYDVGVRVLVPIHWEMFAHNPGSPGALVAHAAQHYPELTVLVLGRGARVTLLPARERAPDS